MADAPAGPEFSVVVPTHDRSELLRLALESVLAQTVTDFEVVVVDDGGTTAELPVDDPRVTLVRRPRGGAAAARNTGIRAARGRFVTFLDDDDQLTPDRLELAREGLRSAPVALCWKAALGTGELRWSRVLSGDCSGAIMEAAVPQLGSAAVRRDLVLPLDETMRASEDVDWWLRMSRVAPVHTVPRVGYLIRDHDGARLRHDLETRLEVRVRLLTEHADYFRAHRRAASYQWRRAGGLAQSLGRHREALGYYARSVSATPGDTVTRVLARRPSGR